jgi:hypothetical protein
MPASDFLDLAGVLIVNEKNESRGRLIETSFGAWQIVETLKAMLIANAPSIPFGAYIKAFGIIEGDKEEADVMTESHEDILEEARKIADAGRKELKK